jgi:hypothetical protein
MWLEFESYDEFLKMLRAEELTKDQRATIVYIDAFQSQIKENRGVFAPDPSLLEKCTFPFETGRVVWGATNPTVYAARDGRFEPYERVVIYERAEDLITKKPNDAESTVLDGRTVYYEDDTHRYTYFAEHEDATVMITWKFYQYQEEKNCMSSIQVRVKEKNGLPYVYYCANLPGGTESDYIVYSSDVISCLENFRLTKNSAT